MEQTTDVVSVDKDCTWTMRHTVCSREKDGNQKWWLGLLPSSVMWTQVSCSPWSIMAPANVLQWVSATLQLAALKAWIFIDRDRQYYIVKRSVESHSSGLAIINDWNLRLDNLDCWRHRSGSRHIVITTCFPVSAHRDEFICNIVPMQCEGYQIVFMNNHMYKRLCQELPAICEWLESAARQSIR